MSTSHENEEYKSFQDLVLEKIKYGEELLISSEIFKLEGIQKLQRKITQELNFLRQIHKSGKIKKEHIQCTNLTHFSAVLATLNRIEKCVSVNKVFLLDDRKITIDIICDDGLTWMKVIARNPKSLSQICMGDASYGVRSVLDHAADYIECAKSNPCLFQIPKVVFVFVNGVGSNLAARIESFGIKVEGERLKEIDINDSDEEISDKKEEIKASLSSPDISNISRVNLDVSAMLAYVSSVCNGSANLYEFPDGVLAQQAAWERVRPQKPILDDFLKSSNTQYSKLEVSVPLISKVIVMQLAFRVTDKKLYCCQTAKDSFLSIVKTVGGTEEKKRAELFLQRIHVLPDDATIASIETNEFCIVQLSADKKLAIGGKIKERSLKIFTFGDRIGAVTVTSNDGFVRAACQQGIYFVVFVHESRALTEQKEKTRAIKKCL